MSKSEKLSPIDELRKKYRKKYFVCIGCRSEYKVPEVEDDELYLGMVTCKCGLKVLIRIENGYVIGIEQIWR